MAPRMRDAQLAELWVEGVVVAELRDGSQAPDRLVPRPYLHPVRTRLGLVTTQAHPNDHPHHMGLGVAIPLVNDVNLWGGPTYAKNTGYRSLDDHGRQVVTCLTERADGHTIDVDWLDAGGGRLLGESRTHAGRALADDPTSWVLRLDSVLTNVSGEACTLGSPGSNGRPGAGYGGIFWRAPAGDGPYAVTGVDGSGEEGLHGRPQAWVLLTSLGSGGRTGWSLLLAPGDERTAADPWFLRIGDYPGVGPALAWDAPLTLEPQARLDRSIIAIVADGHLDPATVPALLRDANR